ncbi:MAG: hypothetical protein ACR2LQ_12210 [Acidimicrobiales bacterium]
MSDTSQGSGWWQASDGKWYAPELHPDYEAPPDPGGSPPAGGPPADFPPVGPPGFTPPGPPPSGPPRDGQPFYRKPIFMVLVVLAVLGAAIAAFAITRSDDGKKVSTKSDSSSDKTDSTDSSSKSKTTTTKKKATTSSTSTSTTAKTAPLVVVPGGSSTVDSSGTRHALAGATVTNPDSKLAAYSVKVVFNLVDAAGTVLDTDTVDVDYIGPSKTAFVAPSQIGYQAASDVAKVDVTAVGDLRKDQGYAGVEFGQFKGIELTVVDAAIVPDEFAPKIVSHVSNPGKEVVNAGQLTCLIFAGTAIVGGTTSYISDTIVPGATIEADSFIDFVPTGADGVRCQAIG